ncbi:MAG: hypothetical protein CMJ81_09585 [Planctomycetaceae bacterium]|nr:hypothetical protein [Planctomycetaceae bacterium]
MSPCTGWCWGLLRFRAPARRVRPSAPDRRDQAAENRFYSNCRRGLDQPVLVGKGGLPGVLPTAADPVTEPERGIGPGPVLAPRDALLHNPGRNIFTFGVLKR